MASVTVTELSELLEISKQRVSDMIADGLPADPPGKKGAPRYINVRAAVDWMVEKARANSVTPDAGETLLQAELRKARGDADLTEIKAALAANEVIPLAEVEALIERTMVVVATQLSAIGGRIAAEIAAESNPAVCRQIIYEECRRVREAMAAEFETRATVAQGGQSDTAATGEDSGSVGGSVPDSPEGER